MLILGVGILAVISYGIFSWKFPKPVKPVAERFGLNVPIIRDAENMVMPDPKVWKQGGKENLVAYKFRCNIKPNKATIAGKTVGMKVPDEYTIDHFTILTDESSGEVMYVHLGSHYHCDKDPISNCMCLVDLYREQLDLEFMENLIDLLSNYDLLDSYCGDHWSNQSFCKLNDKAIIKMSLIVKSAAAA